MVKKANPKFCATQTLTLLWATIVAQNKPSAAWCGRLESHIVAKILKKKNLFYKIFFFNFFCHFCFVVSFYLRFKDS